MVFFCNKAANLRGQQISRVNLPGSKQFGQAAAMVHIPAQTSSSSKNVGPTLRACVGGKPRCLIRACTKGRHFGARPTSSVKREMKAACRLCRSLSRTDNVFLTKMDALPPATHNKNSLPELLQVPCQIMKLNHCLTILILYS